jgi:hypothetical protein
VPAAVNLKKKRLKRTGGYLEAIDRATNTT